MIANQMRKEAYRLLDEADALDPPHVPDWLRKASKPVTAESLRARFDLVSAAHQEAMQK